MASKQFVSGWALMVIGCCGNAPGWANAICGVFGLLLVWFSDNEEGNA
ncbi:hypothetical protein ACNPNN_13050 [Stenotrophomonas geniculata]